MEYLNITIINETLMDNATGMVAQAQIPHKSHGSGLLSGHGPLDSPLSRFLIQASIIITLSRLLHILLHKLKQPRVIAEIVGGICLGPSVFGNIPGFTKAIFDKDSLGFLSNISNVALVYYLFIIGLELDFNAFSNNIRKSALISTAGIVFPFALGVASSWGLYKYMLVPNVDNVPFTSFLLFIGVAMSITAFPILGRILTEKNMLNTPVGLLAISSAALDDSAAWVLLALVISILEARDNMMALYIFLLTTAYSLFLLLILRPILGWLFDRFASKKSDPLSQFVVSAIFVGLFLSAWITEIIGVNSIFGAFLFGLSIPRGRNMVVRLTEKIEDVVVVGFLPLFFANSGLKTNIGLLNDGMTVGWLFVVLFLAITGKLVGCTLMAKVIGMSWREAASVGTLMNTRALIELIVLNIGYDAKVINARIFMIFVIMALVTTFMTSPIIDWLYPPKYHIDLTQGSSAPQTQGDLKILVVVDEDQSATKDLAKLLSYFVSKLEPFSLSTVKLVPSDEREASMMKAAHPKEAAEGDESLKIMTIFGELANVPEKNFLVMSSDPEAEVAKMVSTEGSNLVLVTRPRSNASKDLGRIVRGSGTNVGVYVPAGVKRPDDDGRLRVLVAYMEGPDDSEALRIALRFRANINVSITVLVLGDSFDNLLLKKAEEISVSSHNVAVSYRTGTRVQMTDILIEQFQMMPVDLIVVGRNKPLLASPGPSRSRLSKAFQKISVRLKSRHANGDCEGRASAESEVLGSVGSALVHSVPCSLLVVKSF